MGILKNGILGGVKNKVGAVVGRTHRGQDIITGLHRISTTAKTGGQLDQQDRFGMLNSFLAQLKELIDPGFKHFAKKRSTLNAAFSYNYGHAFVEQQESIEINYPKIVYSRGPVSAVNCPAVTLSTENIVSFSWLPEGQNEYTRASDKATFLIYSAGKKDASCFIGAAKRADLSFSVALNEALIGTDLHCYMNFSNESGKLTGNSMYVGLV